MSRSRRGAAVALGLAAALTGALTGVLAGCSESSDDPSSEKSQAAGVSWSPCDGVTAADAARAVGERVTVETGTSDAPRCTFLPQRRGAPAYDVSYLFFDGGLDAALDRMGAVARQLRPVDVPGADAARLAVRTRGSGVLVTGFVQTDGLVQSVNAVDVAPYDRGAVTRSTRRLLATLAAAAPDPRSSAGPAG